MFCCFTSASSTPANLSIWSMLTQWQFTRFIHVYCIDSTSTYLHVLMYYIYMGPTSFRLVPIVKGLHSTRHLITSHGSPVRLLLRSRHPEWRRNAFNKSWSWGSEAGASNPSELDTCAAKTPDELIWGQNWFLGDVVGTFAGHWYLVCLCISMMFQSLKRNCVQLTQLNVVSSRYRFRANATWGGNLLTY